MADLSKLKIAIGQTELVEGRPSLNEAATDRMIERALDAGADALVVANSLHDEGDVRVIGLNDSRIDVAGNVVLLEAAGEAYRIGVGGSCAGCDLTIAADLAPFTVVAPERAEGEACVVVRPVGIRESGHKVFAYDGGSSAWAPDGSPVAVLADSFEEDFALVDFSAPVRKPEQAERPERKLLDALVSTIRRFDAYVLPYKPCWVIGLSGGLDSSVTAALLVLALGADRVRAYNMATRYNSDTTRSNATRLAEALGIELRGGSIEDLVVSLGNSLVRYGYPADALKGVILENAQARMRGNLLSSFAAVENGVVVNNGNRIESALGYATLYGDAIGALAPIGDLTKVQLFEVARQANERLGVEAIPENLLPTVTDEGLSWETMPSAELANGQVDPMKWFYHDWLVARLLGDGRDVRKPLYEAACDVLEEYADDRLSSSEVARWVKFYGLDDPRRFAEDLTWVVSSMQRSAFKRIQAPPVITLASTASVNAPSESQIAAEPPARYHVLMNAIAHMS